MNGLRIHYLEWGAADKPPLIMLHGIGRIAHTFDHIAPHFASRYHVMAVDMRGHGDSAWDPKGAYLVEDYVKDIEGLAQQLRLRNIVIWGNSTGGRVAQVFAGLPSGSRRRSDLGRCRPGAATRNCGWNDGAAQAGRRKRLGFRRGVARRSKRRAVRGPAKTFFRPTFISDRRSGRTAA